ncbi:MAG: OmpA family protein [Rhizobiaceae bacterium]|nr:OmpA family protein [Rhizobiaceae bacterium]
MTKTADPISLFPRAASNESEIDREALARLLVGIARNVDPLNHASFDGIPSADPRMETMRQLLVGREISELSRVSQLLGVPEQLAGAVGEVLPSAIAKAPRIPLSEAFSPVVEQSVQRSIQKNPRTLTDILYPLFLPAISKSIGEKIDQTFQSLNESLRHLFTWRGLKWRLEAWRTGASFAEVVLKHTLVYRVEHAFLIHRNSGLLIAHATAENATSEDPQLISSMLSAIQDFVKDSFREKEQSGLDTIRFGELRLWSEVGPFATLVAVIRGNPPEELHEVIRGVLLRIHREYPAVVERFDGESSSFPGIETQLQTCVELKQEDSNQGFPWLAVAAVAVVLAVLGGWFAISWQARHRLQVYVSRLAAEPGIVVTAQEIDGGKFHITGLRDPLAADPQSLLPGTGIDPALVHAQWQPFQSLEPEFVLKRLRSSLTPPDTVQLSIDNDRIVAKGEAPDTWIARATDAARQLSAGGPAFDISAVRDVSPLSQAAERWRSYVSRLEVEPGIVVTGQEFDGGEFHITGLRDPLAADPQGLLPGTGLDPALVHAQWQPFQSLEPEFVLKRLRASLTPPDTVQLSIDNDRIVAKGEAPDTWIARATEAARQLSAGGPAFDISAVRDVSPQSREAERWQSYVSRLEAEPGIVVTGQEIDRGQFHITGLRDPLAADPQSLLPGTGIDPALVHAQWQPFQSLEPEFVLKRLTAQLAPPDSVQLSIDNDRIVAKGEAPDTWIARATDAARQLSAGGSVFDVSVVRNVSPLSREADRWRSYVSKLEAEPGIVITEQKMADGQFQISGLRDPLSIDPRALLTGTGIDPASIRSQWQFYQSLDPEFVLKRLVTSLNPPATVQLSIVDERIVAEGRAAVGWIKRAMLAAQQLSADGLTLDLTKLSELTPQELIYLKNRIQAIDIYFDSGKAVPGTEQMPMLDILASMLNKFASDARKAGVTPRFTLTGHSDMTGRENANLSISSARAETVRTLLKKRGVDAELLLVRAAGTFEPAEAENVLTGSPANRRVSVIVNVE